MRTVAEGVESIEEAFYLRAVGVDYGQGYFWSKAIPAAQMSGAARARIRGHARVAGNRLNPRAAPLQRGHPQSGRRRNTPCAVSPRMAVRCAALKAAACTTRVGAGSPIGNGMSEPSMMRSGADFARQELERLGVEHAGIEVHRLESLARIGVLALRNGVIARQAAERVGQRRAAVREHELHPREAQQVA